jgi:hypothetical protein
VCVCVCECECVSVCVCVCVCVCECESDTAVHHLTLSIGATATLGAVSRLAVSTGSGRGGTDGFTLAF